MIVWELLAQITIIAFVVLLSVLFGRENVDMMVVPIIFAIIGCIITSLIYNTALAEYWAFIPIETILYLIFMDVLIKLMNGVHLFEFLALKIIHLTKSNMKLFYYLICITASLLSGVMMDLSVALIFTPIVFRATKILKIGSKPFILGLEFSILIGNLLSPYSMAINIILANFFILDIKWFFSHFFILYVVIQAGTLILIDLRFLRGQPQATERAKQLLLDIMDPSLLIVNRKEFIRYIVYFVVTLAGVFFIPFPFLVVTLAVMVICIVERKHLSPIFGKIGWTLPFLLIGLFLLIGCMEKNGTIELIQIGMEFLVGGNLIIAVLVILVFSSLIGSFISKSLAAIIFMTILSNLFDVDYPDSVSQNVLMMTLIIGINLGSNLIPQSSSHVIYTLEFVKKNKILDLNFKKYTLITALLSTIFNVLGILYLAIYYFIAK